MQDILDRLQVLDLLKKQLHGKMIVGINVLSL